MKHKDGGTHWNRIQKPYEEHSIKKENLSRIFADRIWVAWASDNHQLRWWKRKYFSYKIRAKRDDKEIVILEDALYDTAR